MAFDFVDRAGMAALFTSFLFTKVSVTLIGSSLTFYLSIEITILLSYSSFTSLVFSTTFRSPISLLENEADVDSLGNHKPNHSAEVNDFW